MNSTVKYLMLLNLLILSALLFLYPHRMIAPGEVMAAHRHLNTDCFACHDSFFGAADAKCVACHKVADIGLRNSKGLPLAGHKVAVPFHQRLTGQECIACHSDHAGVAKYRVTGRFSHGLLEESTRSRCLSCHQPPKDTLHRQADASCSSCHGMEKWKPASFEHRKYFAFDRDHQVGCVICHPQNDYKQYTCYGCHEHSAGNIRKKHLKEGIRDYEKCVLCHRNADEDDAERLWKSGRWREGWSGDSPVIDRAGGKSGRKEDD
ncbi:MAG: class III cytochrome C family protein [Magnetococcales bacterium]|nr:class III cytochrome C family protein [Magnetococcales bacterium]